MCPTCGRPYGKIRRCYFCCPRPRTGEFRHCPICAKKFYASGWQLRDVERNQGTYCSRPCKYEGIRRREPKIGGKHITTAGYVSVYMGKGKRQLEHRLVMGKVLGRPLDRREEIHHINGNRRDNRPDNLRMVSPSEHQKMHDFGGRQKGKRIPLTCKSCGATYTRKPSKVPESSYCSHACHMKGIHQGNRKGR